MSCSDKKRKPGPDLVDIEIGARIGVVRRAAGMSQKTLAEAVGVTFQQIEKYERGTNRVAASRLCAIATALNRHVTHFLPEPWN